MLPPIPYNGVLRPTLMLIGMAAMFLLLQRTRGKPYYGRLLRASVGIYLLFLLYATLFSRTAREEYSYRVEPLIMLRQAFTVGNGIKLENPQALEGDRRQSAADAAHRLSAAAVAPIDCRQGGASGCGRIAVHRADPVDHPAGHV